MNANSARSASTEQSNSATILEQHTNTPNTATLHLRASADPEEQAPPQRRPRVRWEEGTVDNEFMDKKKSKICCIFHPQRDFDEEECSCDSDSSSSSGSSSSSSESGDEGSNNNNSGNKNKERRKKKRVQKLPSPNSYEVQPDYTKKKHSHGHNHNHKHEHSHKEGEADEGSNGKL